MPALSFLPEAPRHLLSTSSPSWSPDIQVLDLNATDPDLRGFSGGFASGGYGYFVPWKPSDYSGKVARVDLANFSQVQVLDLTTTDPDLKGFIGGFASGGYAYFVPYLHRQWLRGAGTTLRFRYPPCFSNGSRPTSSHKSESGLATVRAQVSTCWLIRAQPNLIAMDTGPCRHQQLRMGRRAKRKGGTWTSYLCPA